MELEPFILKWPEHRDLIMSCLRLAVTKARVRISAPGEQRIEAAFSAEMNHVIAELNQPRDGTQVSQAKMVRLRQILQDAALSDAERNLLLDEALAIRSQREAEEGENDK